jgi:dTMP kinase
VGITLLGLEVEDHMRGRMFGLVQSLMRIDLLLVTATTPFLAGVIGTREGPLGISVNGVAVVLLVGGLLAALVGLVSYRQMDDRPGVPLRHDLYRRLRRKVPPHTMPGVLVALEGGEGAGKSTQLRLLEQWLAGEGRDVVVTREPGATPVGARIRTLLLDPASGRVAPRAEALLYAADRAQHVDAVLRPALQRGAVVVTDRYVDSSLAYQGAGRELERDDVAKVSQWATGGLRPDLVVLLDVDPVVGLRRAGDEPDRIEAESLEFHQRVRAQFLALAEDDPGHYLVVDASLPPDEVHAAVRERLAGLLPAPAPARVGS